MRHRGLPRYGAVDLYAVDPHLGTLDDYKDLVSAAHQRRMKIFFDSVPITSARVIPGSQNLPLDWFHGTQQNISILFSVRKSFTVSPRKLPSQTIHLKRSPIRTLRKSPPQSYRRLFFAFFRPQHGKSCRRSISSAKRNLVDRITGLDGLPKTLSLTSHANSGRIARLPPSPLSQLTTIAKSFIPIPVTSFFVAAKRLGQH